MVQPAGNLVDEAYSAIREGILRGELRPGMPLSRRRLAEQFGMSVLPVSYALRRLEEDGLVESRPRAGTRVRIPSATDIRDLYELREALETQAARLFSQRATPAQRAELRRHAEQVDVLFNRLAVGDHEALFRFSVHSHHVDFHMRIADHSGSRLLKQIMERKHVLIQNWLLDVAARRTALPDGFHSSLAEALISGDADRADAAMREHVRYGFSEIAGRIRALAASEWRERKPARRRRSESQ
jgi:GntR family transcriptional regulator, rspAB operon transcriptional repressor